MDANQAPPILPSAVARAPVDTRRLDDLLRTAGVTSVVLSGLYLVGACMTGAAVWFLRMAMNDPRFMQAAAAGSGSGGAGAGAASGGAPAATGAAAASPGPPPAFMVELLTIVYGTFGVIALVLMLLNIYGCICFFRRRHRLFLIILSAVNCLNLPLGTAHGIFALLVLLRDGARERFESPA